MPSRVIFWVRGSSDSSPSGQIHLPFPMCGSVGGVYQMRTILWSDGIEVDVASQS